MYIPYYKIVFEITFSMNTINKLVRNAWTGQLPSRLNLYELSGYINYPGK